MNPALVVSVISIAGAIWWHFSTVSGLEDQIADRDKQLAKCQTEAANAEAGRAKDENERLARMLDIETKAYREAAENAEKQAKAQAAAARRARQSAAAAESNLADLQEKLAAETDRCRAVSDGTRRLLDSLATGRGADRLENPGMSEAAAETGAARGIDDAAK